MLNEYASEKQNTLKLEISEEWGWSGNYPNFSLVSKEMMKIWETVSRLELNVILDTGDISNNGYQVENIRFIAQKFPNTKILIEHLGFFREAIKDDQVALNRRLQMISLAKEFKNVFLGVSSVAAFINDEYPCFKALELLENAVKLTGAEKILWGSDIPSTFKKYTYQQMIDVIPKHASFLNEEEMHRIVYQNSFEFFF